MRRLGPTKKEPGLIVPLSRVTLTVPPSILSASTSETNGKTVGNAKLLNVTESPPTNLPGAQGRISVVWPALREAVTSAGLIPRGRPPAKPNTPPGLGKLLPHLIRFIATCSIVL